MARRDTRKNRVRLTKRQKQIKERQKEEMAERERLLNDKITINEKAEAEYLKLEKRFNETFSKIQNYVSAIRGDYLDRVGKEKLLRELHDECKREREIVRKIYGLHSIYLEKVK